MDTLTIVAIVHLTVYAGKEVATPAVRALNRQRQSRRGNTTNKQDAPPVA